MSETESCPACGLSTEGARFCRGCGAALEAPSPFEAPRRDPVAPPSASADLNLRDIAKYQRYIILIILGSILGVGGVAGVTMALGAAAAESVATVFVVVAGVMAVLRVVFVYKLAVAAGISTGWAVIAAVCGIHGLVGLIALLIVNGRATGVLRQAGLRVGLFGVRGEDLRTLGAKGTR